ncbi:hypothetical protein PCL_06349 [Purpureocillium lilacinum]|uniref:Methyltransferase type 11 domain-containing protein n=1 Tax=Purpureocillium lilacinum TaxID=33203 RepID=A0A2U3EMG0_PURLI|nr:hypothetical protein PCL_06349 [Purpureocillium lilacinum]
MPDTHLQELHPSDPAVCVLQPLERTGPHSSPPHTALVHHITMAQEDTTTSAQPRTSSNPLPTAIEHFNLSAAHYERSTGGCTRQLARALLSLPALRSLFADPSAAVLLDNACGTALVTEEVVLRCRRDAARASASSSSGGGSSGSGSGAAVPLPRIHAVDPAANMIDLARAKLTALGLTDGDEEETTRAAATCAVMPGEKLTFPDALFTHSITNLGILFFDDAAAGAREIHRTLRPGSGSVAVVTSWADVGYVEHVLRPAARAARPHDPPFELPIQKHWFDPAHVERCLREDGGFADVEVSEQVVHYGADTVESLRGMLLDTFTMLWRDWSDAEKDTFEAAILERLREATEPYTMVDGDPGVGIRMRAIVAVCRK